MLMAWVRCDLGDGNLGNDSFGEDVDESVGVKRGREFCFCLIFQVAFVK